ncbi:MAG: TolC family protein [Bacteroidales bacterium]|jgi:outer membrane protein TolC|nr:TolC family protein [Bacteroidales bacterium]
MKKQTLILLLGVFLAINPFCVAQDSNLTLTVEQARQYAVEHNRSLQNAALEVKKAASDRWQVISTMLPQVSSSFEYQNLCGYEMMIDMGGGKIAVPMHPNGTLGIRTFVTLSGEQIVGSMLKTLAIDMAKLSGQESDQNIRNQVTNVYMSILVMEQVITLLDSNLTNIQNLQEITENAVAAGAAEETDADQLRLQVAQFRNNINSTKRNLEMSYNSLRLLLGCQVNTELILTENTENLLNIADAEQLLSAAFHIQNNYNYQKLQKSIEMADKQVWLAAVEYFPSVNLFHNYSYKNYFGKNAGMNMTPPNSIGVSLTMPIWSSGTRATKVHSARIAKEIAKNNMDDAETQLWIQDRQLRYNLTSAIENYDLQKDNIGVSQRVFESMSRKFQYGTASSVDINQASNNLIIAQNNYMQSILSLMNAKIALEELLNN